MRRSLLISTGIGCKVLCSYCPQSAIGRAYAGSKSDKRMSLSTFTSCVDKLPGDVTIDFTGFYEPWLNPDCAEMILYAQGRGHEVRLSTTLVGMTLDDVDYIRNVPFTKFAIHLPDNEGLTQIKVTDEYLEVLKALLEAGVSNLALHLHEGQAEVIALQEDVAALLSARDVLPENRWVNTRAGNIDLQLPVARARLQGELVLCPRLRANVLLPNGDVALCCMDWSLQHVIGNLLQSDYGDLFESDEFERVLAGHKDDSIDILCRGCEVARTKRDVAETQFSKVVTAIKRKHVND